MKLHDVIVIGAGPVGSQVAYHLAGEGHEVVVLEQKPRVGGAVCCTGIISQECVRVFSIADHVILRQENSAKLFSPSGRLLRLRRPGTQACIVDRAALDSAMAHRSQNKGTDYVLDSSVRDIEVGDKRVRVGVTFQGERLNFEARAVVIASGFGSRLTSGLGLGKISYFLMGAQAEVDTSRLDEVEVYLGQEVAPGFFAWLVPTSPHKALVGLALRHSSGSYLKKLMSFLRAHGKIVSDQAKIYFRGIPLKPLPRTYSKRLIVVGDAAGQVKPTTGGGIYYGLLCADMAARTLHRALESDDLSAKSLSNYEREWKVKLNRELRVDYLARKFYERLSNRQIDKIFDTIKSKGIAETILKMEDLSFDWHGEVLLRVLKHKAVSRVLEAMKMPFLSSLVKY